MPKLLVLDVMIEVWTSILPFYVCEFPIVCHFVHLPKKKKPHKIYSKKKTDKKKEMLCSSDRKNFSLFTPRVFFYFHFCPCIKTSGCVFRSFFSSNLEKIQKVRSEVLFPGKKIQKTLSKFFIQGQKKKIGV
jgi:hypothetical protein